MLVDDLNDPARPLALRPWADQAELGRAPRCVGPRAAAELHPDVLHVRVDGAGVEEQLARDLAVRLADRDQPQDLDLAPGQAAVGELCGRHAAETALDTLAERGEVVRDPGGERASAETPRGAMRGHELLDGRVASAGHRQGRRAATL